MQPKAMLLSLAALAATPAVAVQALSGAAEQNSPAVSMVLNLLTQMKGRIESDGKSEQRSWDKFASWCEVTTKTKAKSITEAKESLEELQTSITRLGGELGASGAEIEQLRKDIASNTEAQKEASAVRDKQYADYEAEKTESEQCLGALEAAIKVLSGAGTGKAFLETAKKAEIIGAMADVRGALDRAAVMGIVSDKDLQLVQHFVAAPDQLFGGSSSSMSALQTDNNPFGDYAPQSTQIQGILKGMYDAFAGGLEKSNGEEGVAQKAFEELIATKGSELKSLKESLDKQTTDTASNKKTLAESKALRDDTKEELAADEEFFAETKESCKAKARDWSTRSGLRAQELLGVGKAIDILTSGDVVLSKSAKSFVQLSAHTNVASARSSRRSSAYLKLADLATRLHSANIAQVAVASSMDGHFDKILFAIDKMIANLRQEGQEDIEHRDRCQNGQSAGEFAREDLKNKIEEAGSAIVRLTKKKGDLTAKIAELKGEIDNTKTEMKEALDRRNEQAAAYSRALKDDTEAIAIIRGAMEALMEFYKKNKMPISLLSKPEGKSSEGANYTIDPDKAPETSWSDANYGGEAQKGGVISTLEMIVSDLEGEIKTAREDEADAEGRYQESKGTVDKSFDAQTAMKLELERELAETQEKLVEQQERKAEKTKELKAEGDVKSALQEDCGWVAAHFGSRRMKREKEIEGLLDSKNYLGGMD